MALELRRTASGEPPRDANRVGLAGVLADPGIRTRPARVPGASGYGFRWRLADQWTRTWWPQGVSAGELHGRPVVITSWYAQPRRGVEMGSRISVVDLGDPKHPRYHHVLLVTATPDGSFEPVRVHAGGIVWSGDRLFVSATFGGIREFQLDDIVDAGGTGLFGHRFLLPQLAAFAPPATNRERIRYSFLSLERRAADDDLRLVTGEYAKDDRGRVARLHLSDGASTIDEVHSPGIPHMQGAVVHDGRWFISASRGDRRGGDLWTGAADAMVRHEGVLPPGPEDLAFSADRDRLWSVTEYPGKRWIFALDVAALG